MGTVTDQELLGAICDLVIAPPRRTRKRCPVHEKLHYGTWKEYYDTMRMFFDCGTMADYGYGYYEPPPKVRQKR